MLNIMVRLLGDIQGLESCVANAIMPASTAPNGCGNHQTNVIRNAAIVQAMISTHPPAQAGGSAAVVAGEGLRFTSFWHNVCCIALSGPESPTLPEGE